jgi:hypothetical protein
VYDRLLRRLVQTGGVVGTQQISLLPVTEDEFNKLASKEMTPEALESKAKERIALQRQRTESMEIPAETLYDIYARLKEKRKETPSPISLESIWEAISNSRYLRDLGCRPSSDPDAKMITLCNLDSVPSGTLLTVNRSLYEEGGSCSHRRLHFATYGDPAFEGVCEAYAKYALPPCIVRLTEQVSDTHAEVVAFAAACFDNRGNPEIRLIKAWTDLKGLILDESADLSENDLSSRKRELHDMVRAEFDPTRSVERLERENRRAGHAQILLELLTIRSIMPPFGFTEEDNFWTAVKRFDELITERDQLTIRKMPVDPLRKMRKELIFDVPIPKVGETVSPELPILIVSAAVDASCRIAESLKVKKSTLTISTVRSRIEREIGQHMQMLHSL